MLWRRKELGGPDPRAARELHRAEASRRRTRTTSSSTGTEDKKTEVATTQAFVRLLRVLLRDEEIGPRIVPIIPDEGRTFGMESFFKTLKIYNPLGQRYEPVDVETLMPYVEVTRRADPRGGHHRSRIDVELHGGRRPSYATHGQPMIPFFIFYSMFGFQRVGDLIWAFGDAARSRLPARRDGGTYDAHG